MKIGKTRSAALNSSLEGPAALEVPPAFQLQPELLYASVLPALKGSSDGSSSLILAPGPVYTLSYNFPSLPLTRPSLI